MENHNAVSKSGMIRLGYFQRHNVNRMLDFEKA
jgi:hypothetical protein